MYFPTSVLSNFLLTILVVAVIAMVIMISLSFASSLRSKRSVNFPVVANCYLHATSVLISQHTFV